MKRLISGLLCSTLLLGLISNSRILNSYAEEDQAIIASQSDKEAEMAENQVEQENKSIIETTNEEITDSEEKTGDDVYQSENEVIEESPNSSKKKTDKSVLAVTPNQAKTVEGQDLDIDHTTYKLENDSIVITGYKGQKENLVIPSKIKLYGKMLSVKIEIGLNNAAAIFPNNVRSIKFVSVENTKIKLVNNTPDGVSLDYLFAVAGQSYPNLTSIDFSGLDMDNVTSMYASFDGSFIPNLTTISFGDNTLPNVTNMGIAFNKLANLKEIQQQWTLGNVTNMYEMFWMPENNSSQLTSIGDTSHWNTSNVTNMSGMFLNCVKLQNLDLSNWDTSKVTDMSNMFFNCPSLVSIGDTGNWDTSNVMDFKSMFYDCIRLDEIHMDNWRINSNADLGDSITNNTGMFYLYSLGYIPLPALIVASDNRLLSYPYSQSGYKPKCEIRINADTGKVAENPYIDRETDQPTDLSYYFYQTAIPTNQYEQLSQLLGQDLQNKIRDWLESNVPTKDNYALTGWAPTDQVFEQTIQSINSFSDFINSKAEFKAGWVSDKFDTSVDNKKLNPTGSLGLAYYPTTFKIGSTDLHSSGQQKILIPKTDSFNVGVKDRTRTKNEWYVTAQLIWDNIPIPNAYIQTTNSHGTVMQNISTGLGTYSPSTDLKALSDNGITGTVNDQITTVPNTIMKSINGGSAVNNGVYDYDLGDLKLVIPDVSQVRAGTYSGQVEWNLINGPA
ncbi:BspA family leucine-rich repeat surface protein [Enterococcus hirae]